MGNAVRDGSRLVPVPISALQHYSYCPRQCALIHVEQVYTENLLTIRGKLMHGKVDSAAPEVRDGVRIERSMDLWSDRYGLIGKADVVEFHSGGLVVPVEYKHGKRHRKLHDDIQLCAQAVCLEEILGVTIERGFVYHYSSRRRREVLVTPRLREVMAATADSVRDLILAGGMPPPASQDKCRNCSLAGVCSAAVLRGRDWQAIRTSQFSTGEE